MSTNMRALKQNQTHVKALFFVVSVPLNGLFETK